MKTIYTRITMLLKGLVTLLFVGGSMTLSAQTVETIVFSDDFSGVNLSGGNPATTYTIVKQTGVGDEATDPSTTTTIDMLRIPNRKGTGFWGRNGVFGILSVYSAPFNGTLSALSVDSVVWTFNLRQNYNSTLSGFNDVQNAVGAILLADNASYATANGYAVVYGETALGKLYRLVKFENGINENTKLTTLATGTVSPTDGRDYMSFRVVYVKSSNTWIFKGRFDGPNTGGAFADPKTGTFGYSISAVNADLVNTPMTHFGFFQNYSGNIDKIMWVDNYTVATYHQDLGTSLNGNNQPLPYSTRINQNGITVQTTAAVATLFNSAGNAIQQVNINGEAQLNLSQKGFYLLKIEMSNGETAIEKVLF